MVVYGVEKRALSDVGETSGDIGTAISVTTGRSGPI